MLHPWFVFLAAVINIAGTVAYIITTLKGRTRPNRVTWFIWGLAPLITFSAQLSKGVGLEALLTFTAFAGPLAVFAASFVNKNAYWKISRLDWWCGGIALLAIALWAITREGLIAIALSILADLLAGVPTIIKAYREPESENAAAYITACISGIITLLTISVWTPASASFAIYMTLITGLITALILWPRRPGPKLKGRTT